MNVDRNPLTWQIFALMNESVISIMSGFYFLKHFFVTKVSSVLSTSI